MWWFLVISNQQKENLEVTNAAAWLLTGTRSRDHISPVLAAIHRLHVTFRINFKVFFCLFLKAWMVRLYIHLQSVNDDLLICLWAWPLPEILEQCPDQSSWIPSGHKKQQDFLPFRLLNFVIPCLKIWGQLLKTHFYSLAFLKWLHYYIFYLVLFCFYLVLLYWWAHYFYKSYFVNYCFLLFYILLWSTS